jgi:hypothetical protein
MSVLIDAMQDVTCQLLGRSAVDYSSTRNGRDTARSRQETLLSAPAYRVNNDAVLY